MGLGAWIWNEVWIGMGWKMGGKTCSKVEPLGVFHLSRPRILFLIHHGWAIKE